MFSGLAVSQDAPVRRWTALASFTLQGAIVAAALVYPLLNPESLPRIFHPVLLPISSAAPPAEPQARVHNTGYASQIPIVVSSHSVLFGRAQPRPEGSGPIAPDYHVIGTGDQNGLQFLAGEFLPPTLHPVVPPRNIRGSVVMEGNLIHKVDPQYPAMAKQIGLQGAVVLKAFISCEGVIERVQVEKGHPILARAAQDAVRQWRYKPYFLNGEPIEVETEVTVNFVLQR